MSIGEYEKLVKKGANMKCIRNICLYLKKYISDKQFERIFYQDIDDFKNSLEENIYWKILWIMPEHSQL